MSRGRLGEAKQIIYLARGWPPVREHLLLVLSGPMVGVPGWALRRVARLFSRVREASLLAPRSTPPLPRCYLLGGHRDRDRSSATLR